MRETNTVLLIPDKGNQANGEPGNYPNFLVELDKSSHELFPLVMDYSGDPDPDNWAEQILYQTRGRKIHTIVGHSWGSIAALVFEAKLAGERRRRDPLPSLVIVSEAARYADDLEDPEVEAYVMERHNNKVPVAFKELHSEPLINTIRSRLTKPDDVAVFVGEQEVKEYAWAGRRAEKTAELFGVPLQTIPGAPHHFDLSPTYVKRVVGTINGMRARRWIAGTR
jgi:hypothetical protein